MNDFGLEVRDADNNVIIDSSTFTVRQVAKRFISRNDLILKVGRGDWTGVVQFPWAESKYGMFISVTQVNLNALPTGLTEAQIKASKARAEKGSTSGGGLMGIDYWIKNAPRLPVAKAFNGYVTLEPAVMYFNADVWLSLYVVV